MNLAKSVALALLCLGIMHGAGAHGPNGHPTTIITPAAHDVEPLAARFDLSNNQTRTTWYLWRDSDAIETTDLATGQSNIWEKQGRDDYSYRRIFHRDQRIVEYTPGELRTHNILPDWSKLASVVSPQLLESLKRGPAKMEFGQKSVLYTGTLNGQTVSLWWLEKSRLPAHLRITGGQQRLELRLRELRTTAPNSWPRASDERISGYNKIDAADLGDMENDPFVARLIRQDGHPKHF